MKKTILAGVIAVFVGATITTSYATNSTNTTSQPVTTQVVTQQSAANNVSGHQIWLALTTKQQHKIVHLLAKFTMQHFHHNQRNAFHALWQLANNTQQQQVINTALTLIPLSQLHWLNKYDLHQERRLIQKLYAQNKNIAVKAIPANVTLHTMWLALSSSQQHKIVTELAQLTLQHFNYDYQKTIDAIWQTANHAQRQHIIDTLLTILPIHVMPWITQAQKKRVGKLMMHFYKKDVNHATA